MLRMGNIFFSNDDCNQELRLIQANISVIVSMGHVVGGTWLTRNKDLSTFH